MLVHISACKVPKYSRILGDEQPLMFVNSTHRSGDLQRIVWMLSPLLYMVCVECPLTKFAASLSSTRMPA